MSPMTTSTKRYLPISCHAAGGLTLTPPEPQWETESMTDVDEPTANTGPTIDAECQVHLAGRDILLVCAPRIEEGWEEIQKVRKPTAVGVGECGVASRKKASIDEGPDSRGNQGVVRDAEVCFAAPSFH